jgi:rhodanese-related sulfurtransferase
MFGFMRAAPAADYDAVMPRITAGEMTLVDVREAGELAMTGRAAGAINIPLMRLPMMADPRHPDAHPGLDPARPVALYCASGARSAQGKMLLERLGYADVVNLGGLSDWARAGGKLEH